VGGGTTVSAAPRAEQSKGWQSGCKMNILNKNFDCVRQISKLFGRMKGNSVNGDFFKFIISLRGGYFDSLRA
jgi:hypothetical protein